MTDILSQLQSALSAEFRLERELGGGGMSQVFLAEELELHRRVVIKVLPPDLAGSVNLERFRREIQVAAALQHPHIVPILRAGIAGELLYYTMPYIDGESLRSRLARERRLPPLDAARILRDVADALSYAHRHGVAHRDVKPDNILLAEGHALVTDFGVARALGASGAPTLTATGIAIGTPLYMAPEQAAGDPLADHRVDLYALGVVAYEMLVGQPPFEGDSPQAILAQQLTATAAPVRRRAPDTPAALAGLVDRCLARDPGRRAQSAEELIEPLAAVATPSGAVPAGRVAPGQRARALARRWAPAAAAALAMVMLGGWELRARSRVASVMAASMAAAEAGRFDDVFDAVTGAGADLGSRRYRALAARAAGRAAIETSPAGADMALIRVTPLASFAQREPHLVGRSPLRATLVAGEYLVRLEGAGVALEVLLTVAPDGDVRLAPELAADSAGALVAVAARAARGAGAAPVPAFRIGRTEVTNTEYQRFVAAGGYRDAALWPDSMVIGGVRLARVVALGRLVDRTGVPGPLGWANGAYAPGEGARPVVGVSWYEAAAYARWLDARLPTADEWYRAALGDGDAPFPWGADAASAEQRANFGGVGATDAGTRPLSVSPVGAHDMAGNVREWVADAGTTPGTRLAVGGSWQEPSYGFERGYSISLEPGARREVVGFRLAAAGGR